MAGDFSTEGGWLNGNIAPILALAAEFTTDGTGSAFLSTEATFAGQVIGVELSSGITVDLAVLTRYGNDLMDEAGTALSGKADFEVPAPVVGGLMAQISNAGASVSGTLVLYVQA